MRQSATTRKPHQIEPEASAAAHNNLAVLFDRGRLVEAISHYQASIRLEPKSSARAHKNLGLALWAKGQQDEAIGQYQESIRRIPKVGPGDSAQLCSHDVNGTTAGCFRALCRGVAEVTLGSSMQPRCFCLATPICTWVR